MGSPTFYRFRSNWELDAPRGHVFEVLKKGRELRAVVASGEAIRQVE